MLTTLVSVSPIYASFDADEQAVVRALKDMKQGIPVEMETALNGSTPVRGRLQLIDNQVNAKSGTVRVRAVFENKDGSLIPGQFAKLRMGRAKTAPAVLVSERAVGTDQNKKFVIVVDQGNIAAYREVVLGAFVGGLRVITSGLAAGERIVVNGLQRVRPGALVAPETVTMDGQSVSQARTAPETAKAVLR